MKEIKWQGIGFFILLFVLAIGLSYLAFNENSKEKVRDETRMSIALVNEDAGTNFNDEQIVFGDDFAQSVNKDDNHDWYVVSRGVAESGFERNSYDMMIVIPQDFSERSLSIHLDKPEPVSLHYKVNATGHEQVRDEAEKTAERILNDFNERLIDVYFASIIGNLQNAQDDIREIIDKEAFYTNAYAEKVHAPLAGYTDQFEMVRGYTDTSKQEYKNLEDVLKAFDESIAEKAGDDESFTATIDDVLDMKAENGDKTTDFGNLVDTFVLQLNKPEVSEQLSKLQQENDAVYRQFQKSDDEISMARSTQSLRDQSDAIKHQLDSRKIQIAELEKRMNKKIDEDLKGTILKSIDGEIENDVVDDLFPEVDEKMRMEIERQISKLPTLDIYELEKSPLTDTTLQELKNITEAGRKSIPELKLEVDNSGEEGKLLSSKIEHMKTTLANEGVVVTDHVQGLPIYNENSVVMLEIPEHYELKEWRVNEVEGNGGNPKVELDSDVKDIDIEAKFALVDEEADIDIFQPLEWEWKVVQEGQEEEVKEQNISGPKPENENDDSTESNQEDKEQAENTEENDVAEENGDDDNATNDNEANENDGADQGGKDDEGENGNNDNSDEDKEEELGSITLVQTNNYLHQRVQSPLFDDQTEQLMDGAVHMVTSYYNLQSLLEQYYGVSLTGEEDKPSWDPEVSLKEQATEDSIYHLLYKTEVEELLGERIAETVTADIQESFISVKERMNGLKKRIDDTYQQADDMVGTMKETHDHAESLNAEVNGLLSEVEGWHEESKQLAEEKSVVLDDDQSMQTAVMELSTSYQPLLMSSESLREQAKTNFTTADRVYETFDALDKETGNIEQSGEDLVQYAGDLADQLTNKAAEDDQFADNFDEVLANSRVGDRQNEALYSFLSNPVQTENDGVLLKGKSFSPYFLVLILSMLTLFTSYVITNMEDKRQAAINTSEEKGLAQKNRGTTVLAAGIGAIEGLVIGLVSFYFLGLDKSMIYLWLGMMTLLMLVMTMLSTYLLRQLKMIGMFIILAIFSLYLLLTRALGFHFEHANIIRSIRQISPLQYVENLLTNMIEGKGFSVLSALLILLLFIGVGFVLNLFVIKRQNGGESDEEFADAN